MLVVSFRGANYGFWYHLGGLGRNTNIMFTHQDIVRVALEKGKKRETKEMTDEVLTAI